MKCLIIAAGQGSRLQEKGPSKPLTVLAGAPILEHVIRAAREGGVREFFVVTGYRGQSVRQFLDQFSRQHHVRINHIINEDWRMANGISVLKAKELLDEQFLLLMADHLFDPQIVKDLIQVRRRDLVLSVDRRLDNPLIDLSDVTKVRSEQGRIQAIGKELVEYDAYDTGIFMMTPRIFGALEDSRRLDNDESLSGGVRRIAARDGAWVHDIHGRFWIDVDDPVAYDKASIYLERQCVTSGTVVA